MEFTPEGGAEFGRKLGNKVSPSKMLESRIRKTNAKIQERRQKRLEAKRQEAMHREAKRKSEEQ